MKFRPIELPPQGWFPEHALPEMIRRAVWATCRKIQSPYQMVATLAIGVVSEAVQGLAGVQIPHGPYCPLSNWVMVVGVTGMGKTPSLNMLRQAIVAFETQQYAYYLAEMEKHQAEYRAWELELAVCEQAIRKAARKGMDTHASKQRLTEHMACKPKPPRQIKLTYLDTTPEAFCQGLCDHWSNASLVNDEAASCLNGHMGQAMAMLNQRWEFQPLSIDRVSRGKPLFVQDPRVMLSWAMQPDPFWRYMERRGQEARELGTHSRFLWCLPDNNQGLRDVRPVDIDPQELTGFHDRVTECLQASVGENGEPLKEKLVMTFSEEAAVHYHQIREQIEVAMRPGHSLANVKDYAAKAPRHLARLAGVFEYFETGNTIISLEMLERAEAVMTWYINEYIRIFVPPPERPQEQQDADRLQSWLHQFAHKRCNRYLIKNDIRKHVLSELRDKARLQRALGVLQQRGWIMEWLVGKVGVIDMLPNHFRDHVALNAALQTYRASRCKPGF
ncbi:hypothetical protein B0T37_04390 [Chromobacterium violaceum]|uniref:YfjI family protein n=1 Tax=Chromobacterium violaceum TaxID=536 RepID=UPI0009DA8906|nr:YfjI family protein [Chromobacterium violaceum]OQS11653.1 hypothetical protein B0T38_02900 [Chromobacterium violaceum]OQS29212.1 hypothetical protein B0T37_04390 [Chromobacterium violaceum]